MSLTPPFKVPTFKLIPSEEEHRLLIDFVQEHCDVFTRLAHVFSSTPACQRTASYLTTIEVAGLLRHGVPLGAHNPSVN
jgi:hypothetical protein